MAYSFVACLTMTIDHASLSRRSRGGGLWFWLSLIDRRENVSVSSR